MLLYEIIWKRHTAINQLAEGLKQQEVLQSMRKHPDNFAEKFVASKLPLSAEMLIKEMVFTLPSNEEEERAKSFFKDFLELQGEISTGNGK